MTRAPHLTLGAAALAALIGCSSAGGTTSAASEPRPSSHAVAGLDCLRAEGGRFPNVAGDWRLAPRRARASPVVELARGRDATVVVWERTHGSNVARVYLYWRGRHDTSDPQRAGARALRVVERDTAHPKRATDSPVLLGDGSRADADRLDAVCLGR